MKLGSLFSGGGLGDFGFLAAGMEIAWQCEIDPYCQKILALRYPESKKYTDIKLLKGADLERVDIITGGFPCQPFSVAGKQKGKEDNRYLWPEMLRVIRECRPRWVIGENVPGIINLALGTVCADMEAEGFEVWPIVFPSHALGAWHKRDRLWFICHAKHNGQPASKVARSIDEGVHGGETWPFQTSEPSGSSLQHAPLADTKSNGTQGGIFEQRREPIISQCGEVMADSANSRIESLRGRKNSTVKDASDSISQRCEDVQRECSNAGSSRRDQPWADYWWNTEPRVGRVANGIADRVHRLKMLGNGQTPACTYVLGRMIMEIENAY